MATSHPPTLGDTGPLARLVARVGPIGCPALLVIAVVAAVAQTCGTRTEAHAVAEAFFADLRQGRVEAAHGRLTSARRQGLALEQFDAATSHPVFRETGALVLQDEVTTWDMERHVCVPGAVTRADGEWAVELHLVKGDDGYRVHEWGLEPPRPMARLHVLDACR